MKPILIRRALATILITGLYCAYYVPPASAEQISPNEWKVSRGDTLYAISRSIFPADAGKQARLRQDIMRINPAVFANGANQMPVGIVLKLPAYVSGQPAAAPVKKRTQVKPKIEEKTPPPGTRTGADLKRPQWTVKPGDTLYGISRAIYPDDARKQAGLRRDIIRLNQAVFAKGASNLDVGVKLTMPRYVTARTAPSTQATIQSIPETEKKSAVSAPPIEPETEAPPEDLATEEAISKPEPAVKPGREPTGKGRRQDTAPSSAEVVNFVGLGYSYGGDELVKVDGWPDVTAGAGFHLRAGLDRMPQRGSGFRLALGLLFNAVYASNADASFEDFYLQLAYQYRSNPFIYGIGVVSHDGPRLDNDNLITDFDTAHGAVFYLEHVGNGALAGWGLSYTDLEFEEEDSTETFDASRLELYYNWRF